MSIPLYYAMPFEAFREGLTIKSAQLDFCFYKDGTLSVPKQIIPNSPIIINDAFSPAQIPEQATISHIISLSSHGCFLDFERPPSDWSISLLKGLRSQLPVQRILAVPPAYAPYAENSAIIIAINHPVNNWTQFCRRQQQTYKKWMLEIIPYKTTIPKNTKNVKTHTICKAVCICRTDNNGVSYFDTMETILSKLEIAEYYGCIAGIGLLHELEELELL